MDEPRNSRISTGSILPWEQYAQWEFKEAYRRFLDDTDIEICPWVQFEDLELKTALNLNAKISEATEKGSSSITSTGVTREKFRQLRMGSARYICMRRKKPSAPRF